MADEIRIPVAADTTPMERDISNAASRARVSIRADLDSRQLEAFSRPLGKITGQADEFTKSMDAANARVLAFGASVGVVNSIANAFKNLVTSTIEVEKSLNEISIIGDKTFKNLNQVSSGVFLIAKQLGTSFKDASEATLEFARQGKDLESSLQAARAALALTRTSGLDAAESVKGLTSAVNAFGLGASGYVEIVNKMSSVSDAFAVNNKDLIEGISRSASVAQEAGVSFNELVALITTLEQRTGRGGAVIGNALKTIFTRVQNPEILKDIRGLGIAVQDIQGNFLPATQIIKSLASEFNNLDANVRKSLLLKVGGGFQIDKLAAALDDVAEANGTFQKSLAIASSNTGDIFGRVEKMNQTIDSAFTNMATSAKQLGSTIGQIAFADDFRKILENGASLFEGLNKAIGGGGEEGEGLTFGQSIAKGIVKGIGSVISGPGLFLFGGILLKLTADFAKFSVSGVQTLIGITSKSKEQEAIQRSIQTVLGGSVELQSKLFSLEGNKTAQAQVLLNTYIGVANQMERISSLSRNLSQPLYEGGVRLGSGSLQVKGAANGYVPNLATAISNERQQSPASSKIIVDHNFPMGGGQRGTMVYNSNETRIKNFGGSGGDAIIPNYPVSAAGGYVPNFAVKPGNYAGKLAKGGKGDLRLDAMQASVAGLTLAGERSKFESSKPLPIDDKLLKNYQGSPLFDKLSEYDRVALTNVPVGNVYRFRKGLKQDEDTIKADFVSKLNTVLRPSILSFIDAEVNSLGLKTGGGLKGNLENLKTDLIGTTTAGYILEEILKIPTLTNAEKIAQYAAQSEKAYFDIQNLDSDTAEAYGLPKKNFLYADVKLGEGELYDGITKKYLNQAVYEGGGTKLKNAGKGYVPNFGKISNLSPGLKNYYDIDNKIDDKIYNDSYANDVVIQRYNLKKSPQEYRKQALNLLTSARIREDAGYIKSTYGNFLSNKFNYDKIFDESPSSTKGTLNNLQGAIGEYEFSQNLKSYKRENNQLAGIDFYSASKNILVEIKTRQAKLNQKEANSKVLAFLGAQKNLKGNKKNDSVDLSDINFRAYEAYANAAKGYIPNFANTSTASGGIMRYKPSYSRTTPEEAVASLDATKGTRLTGTNLGSPAPGGKVNLNEDNIIASILGNNTFFQKNTSQSDTEKNLLTFVNRLTSQGRIVKFGKESADFAFASGSYDVKPEQIISGNIAGKFKNIDYNKLGKIFPRLWRAKGVGDTWDLVKAISTYNSVEDIINWKYTEAGKKYSEFEIADKKKNLPSYTEILRNVAISSVKDYDKDLLGFNINIAGSADEATLKDYRVGGDTSYLSLFGSKAITGARNVGQSAARERSIITSLPQDIKSTFTKGGSSTYGSFAKWYDQNAATFNFKSKKQAQEELAQVLKLKSINYDGASKRMVFNAANGYVPNFAGDALNSAIMREKMTTGLSGSMISVSQDSRAVNSQFNPSGLIVTNKIDEPNGAASVTGARITSAYRNAGRGFIPNFSVSDPIAFENVASNLNIDTSKLKSVIEENVTSIKENTKIQKELTDFQKKRLEAERKKTEQELKQFSTAPPTTTSRTVPNTPTENSNKSNISQEVKNTEKSFADIAAKVFVFQSALSLASGFLSTLGEKAGIAGQAFNDLGQSIFAATQVGDLKSTIAGKKTEGETGLLAGGSKFRNVVGLGVGIAGGIFVAAQAVSAIDKGIQVLNGTFDKSKNFVDDLNNSLSKYNVQLTDQQKRVSDNIVNKAAGSGSGIGGYFNQLGLGGLFEKPDVANIIKSLSSTNLTKEANADILKQATSIFAPQENQKFINENKRVPKTKELEDAVTKRIAEEFGALEAAPENRKNVKTYTPGVGGGPGTELIQNVSDEVKLREAIQKLLEANIPLAKNAEFLEKERTAALLQSVNILNKQLDLTQNLSKLQLSIPSALESSLSIEKDLLTTTEARRMEIDRTLKSLQEQRQLTSDIKDTALNFGREKVTNYLGSIGSTLGQRPEVQESIQASFGAIASSTNEKQATQAVNTLIQKLSVSAGGKETEGQTALRQQAITELKIGLEITKATSAAKELQNKIEDSNLAISKRNNYEIILRRDALNSELTVAQKRLEFQKQELDLRRQSADIKFETSQIGRPSQRAAISQAEKNLLDVQTRPKEDLKNQLAQYEIARKQSIVSFLEQKNTAPLDVERILKEKPETQVESIQKILQDESNSFTDQVRKSGDYFYEAIVKSTELISSKLNPNQQTVGEKYSDVELGRFTKSGLEGLKAKIENQSTLNPFDDELVNRIDALLKAPSVTAPVITPEYAKTKMQSFSPVPPAVQAALDKNKDEIDRAKALLEEQRSKTTFRGGATEATVQIQNEIDTFQNTLGKTVPMGFRDGMVSAMKELSNPNSTEPLKNRLLGVALAFTQKIQDALMTNLANKFTSGVTGLFEAKASGGPIMGGSGTKDDVPAMLMGGEYVITKSAAQKYGPDFLNSLNKGNLKKFAAGGFVGAEELNLKQYAENRDNYIDYNAPKSGSLVFNQSGGLTRDLSYKGSEENGLRQKALMEAQTKYYGQNQQTGQGGFYMPGQGDSGAIMGQKNLLAFATQQTAGTKFDNISSSGGVSSVNIGAGSQNLSLFALRDQGNSMSQEYLQSKQKALDLYMGGQGAAKDKATQDYDNQKAYEKAVYEYEMAKKTAQRQMYQGLIRQAAITAAVSAVSYGVDKLATTGGQAAQQAKIDAINEGIGKSDYSQGYDQSGQLYSSNNLASIENTRLTFGEQALGYNGKGGFFRGSLSGQSNNLIANDKGLYSWENGGYNKVNPSNWNNVNYGSKSIMIGGNNYYPATMQRKAAGGLVAGNGMGDNVPTMLNGGEFVISKQAAQNIGTQRLQQLNSSSSSAGTKDMTEELSSKFDEIIEKLNAVGIINITVNSNGKQENNEEKESSTGDAQSKELARRVKDVVLSVLREEKRLGGLLR